jgi:hypothetical protein
VPTFSQAEPLPASLVAFEAVQDQIPRMNLGGLSLCKLLARRGASPFFALPSDRGEETCDLSRVRLAYHGWCTAGVEDVQGPHFSQSMLPSVEIVDYEDGGDTITIIFLNHYLKARTPRTPAGAEAARAFFDALPATLDIRGARRPVFPKEYEGQLPPRKEE